MPSIVDNSLTYDLWVQAQSKLEWATVKFWGHKFSSWYSNNEKYASGSEQPPTNEDDDRRRIDWVMDSWKGRGKPMFRIFIFEAKKHGASQTEIQTLEGQVYEACIAHLVYSGREYMYAMTAIGTLARMWIVHIGDDYLTPWIPEGWNLADKSQYIEAHSSDGSFIEDAHRYMKKHEEMPLQKVEALRAAERQFSTESTQLPAGIDHSSSGSGTREEAGPNVSYASYDAGQGSGSSIPSQSTVNYASYSAVGQSGSSSLPIRVPSATQGSSTQVESEATEFTESTESKDDGSKAAVSETAESDVCMPDDAVYVLPQVQEKANETVYHFDYKGKHYAKPENLWREGKIDVHGAWYNCVYYVGSATGTWFWTYSLRELEPVETGKAKKGKGKGR